MEHWRLIVDKALQVDVQRFGNIIQRLNVNRDRAVLVFGKSRLALVDHGRKLLNRISATFAVFLDSLTNMIRECAHDEAPFVKVITIITCFFARVNQTFLLKKIF